jgi:hypothetical protein
VPVRADVDVFAVAENDTEPEPDPFEPAVIVNHVALLFAVHVQPPAAVTETCPVDATDPSDAEADPRLKVQAVDPAVVVNPFDGLLGDDPPGPTANTRASYVTPLGGHVVTSELRLTVIVPEPSGVGLPRLYDTSGTESPRA